MTARWAASRWGRRRRARRSADREAPGRVERPGCDGRVVDPDRHLPRPRGAQHAPLASPGAARLACGDPDPGADRGLRSKDRPQRRPVAPGHTHAVRTLATTRRTALPVEAAGG